jgi:hypothetical protein
MLNTRPIKNKKDVHLSSSSSSSSTLDEKKTIQNDEFHEFDNDNVFIQFDDMNNNKNNLLNQIITEKNVMVKNIPFTNPEKNEIIQNNPSSKPEKNEIIQNIPSSKPENNKSVDYDKIQNKFIIYEQSEIKTILLSDVINSILNAETNDAYIKKYLFIISFNSITNQNEYNFMPSVLTENLDMLIELENSIFTIINNDEFETKELKHKTNLILFFYQIVMFIYKSTFNYYDDSKLKTIYNILSYRFSLIILKQIYNLKDEIKYLNSNFKESLEIKHKLESKIFGNLKEEKEEKEEKNENLVGGYDEESNEENNDENNDEDTNNSYSDGGNYKNDRTVNNDLSSVSSSSTYSSVDSDEEDDDDDKDSYNINSASMNASFYKS